MICKQCKCNDDFPVELRYSDVVEDSIPKKSSASMTNRVMAQEPVRISDVMFGIVVVASAIAVVTGTSVWFAMYRLDPHHWGLILSNAVDLARGRIPYQEVFIQYGLMTAVFTAWFYKLGGTQISIVTGIAILYALGIAGTYFVSLQVSARRRLAIYSFLTVLLVHPLAILPWPNYVAFPFIVFGCVFTMMAQNKPVLGLLGGALLGLAVLCREGLLLAIILPLLLLPLLELWSSGNTRRAASRLTAWCGFAIPLVLFALYLGLNGLGGYWWTTAVELPKLYTKVFFEQGIAAALEALVAYVLPAAPLASPQIFVIGLVLASAAYFCFLGLFRTEARRIGPDTLFLALLTGLLTSSALHLNDFFRLATSVTAGTPLLFLLASRFRIATPLFGICAVLLLAGIWGNSASYLLPSRQQVETGIASSNPPVFSGQRWPSDVYSYYDWYANSMHELDSRNCGIAFIRNETLDSYLEALSPFRQYQLAPYGTGFIPKPKPPRDDGGPYIRRDFSLKSMDDWGQKLRPDYDLSARLSKQDIVIVTRRAARSDGASGAVAAQAEEGQPSPQVDPALPPGYAEFSSRMAPDQPFYLAEGPVTSLWAPVRCITSGANQTLGSQP